MSQPPDTLRKSEFAAAQGWSKSYVSKLTNEGRLVLTDDGRVRVAESLARIAATTRAPERASAPVVGTSAITSRERKEHYDAENARIDYEQRIGRLIEAEPAVAIVADMAVRVRMRLESLPDQLAPQIAGLGADEARIRNLLAEHIEITLRALAQHSQRMANLANPAAAA